MASALVGFGWSARASTAFACPSHVTITAVCPSSLDDANDSRINFGNITRRSRNISSRPTVTMVPPIRPVAPTPGRDSKSSRMGNPPTSSSAVRTIARAMGCSLLFSTAPAYVSASVRVTPSTHTTPTNDITPVVTVPVLSRITVSMRRVLCKTSMPLITMPIWAARPLPTMRAVGVANPKAHGHAMISTATAAANAFAISPSRYIQTPNVPALIANTTGTKTLLTLSANLCTGAFVA